MANYLDALFTGQSGSELALAGSPVFVNTAITPGYLYEITSITDLDLTIESMPAADVVGQRIAIKVVVASEAIPTITVTAPAGQKIERDNSAIEDYADVTQVSGTYREWLCDRDGVWRLVGSADVDLGGGSEAALQFDTGLPIPLGMRPTSGQVLTFDGDEIVGTDVAGGGSASEPYAHPAVADSRDDEFETTTLGVGWGYYGTAGGAASLNNVLFQFSIPNAGPRYRAHTDRRPSWLSIQPESGAGYVLKPISMGTNDCCWARVLYYGTVTTGGSNKRLKLVLMGQTAGHPDPNNCVKIGFISANDLNYVCQASVVVAGTTINMPASESDSLIGTRAFEYFAIDKRGTDYFCFASGTGPGTTAWQFATGITFTPVYAGFEIQANASNAYGDMFGMDFIRFNTGGFLALPI